jgi:hypothetical protein
MGRFPNAAACLRPVAALCIEQSKEWLSGKYYLDVRALAKYHPPDGPIEYCCRIVAGPATRLC